MAADEPPKDLHEKSRKRIFLDGAITYSIRPKNLIEIVDLEIQNSRVTEMLEYIFSVSQERNIPSGFLLSLLLPSEMGEDAIANLEEIFKESWIPRYGYRQATWIWRIQSLGIVIGHHWNRLASLISVVWKYPSNR